MRSFAYVLVAVEPGQERHVLAALAKVPGVSELYAVQGDIPVLARVEAVDLEGLGAVIIRGIRAVVGVTNTTTLPGARLA